MGKALILLLVLALPGCASITAAELLATAGSWVADGVVQAETGKNITDKVVSDITGKDCELKKVFKEGEQVCKEITQEENQEDGKGKEEQR